MTVETDERSKNEKMGFGMCNVGDNAGAIVGIEKIKQGERGGPSDRNRAAHRKTPPPVGTEKEILR